MPNSGEEKYEKLFTSKVGIFYLLKELFIPSKNQNKYFSQLINSKQVFKITFETI